MNVDINMIDVKDGDAIVVTLCNKEENLILLIDAGKSNYSEKVIQELDKKLGKYNKLGPDIVLVTHYDSDHIGGIVEVLDTYGRNIGELWIHTPTFENDSAMSTMFLKPKVVLLETNEAVKEKMEIVIESVNELKCVIDKATELGITINEPFAGECGLEKWPTLRILGPTREYYRRVFKNLTDTSKFVKCEADNWILAESSSTSSPSVCPCDQLTTSSDTKPSNMTSVVLVIEHEGRKYLFTGDAGIESFKQIPNYQEELKNIYWLKAPHHGSANNISLDFIRLMRPKYVYISGDKNVDQRVIDCFKTNGSEIRFTKQGNLAFSPNQRFKEMLQGI